MFSLPKPTKKPGKSKSKDAAYDAKRRKMAARSAEQSRKGRDVSDNRPDCTNTERRKQAEASLEYFLRTYLSQTFNLPWSQDHRTAIVKLESAIRSGGQFAYAMPRGSGKTSMAEGAALWAALFGLRRFVMLIGSDKDHAGGMLDSIKAELETNDLLDQDFHFTCGPIRKLEGIAHRCKGQTWKDERTRIAWTNDLICLPTVPGSLASGAIIRVAGLTGGIRGKKFKHPDGQSIRPDLAILDDPQTDEAARSPSQVATRAKLISGAVLGLAGPGKKIAAVMPCTVIAPDDLADRFLNQKKHPEWHGERAKMMYAFPTNTVLWEQYTQIRADSQRAGNEGREATEFYLANREAMDAGAQPAWPARFNPDEISAVQHAMNLRIDLKDHAFFAEYQNEPLVEQLGEKQLTADQIAAKINNLDRRLVPVGCDTISAFIDVQGSVLYYVVVAWGDGFTGYVIDYGTFPDQKRAYFTLSDIRNTLARAYPVGGEESQIYAGLKALTESLLDKVWLCNGTELRISRCLIDAGYKTDTVFQFCRQSKHAALLMPSHGHGIGASGTPFEMYKPGPGERIGKNWLLKVNQRGIRYARIDTNYWKTFVHNRLKVGMGDKGCLSFFGKDANAHQMFAEHLTAEYAIKTEGRGRTVMEWKAIPGRDNHFFDCLTGAATAASIAGISLETGPRPVARPRRKYPRVSYMKGW